LPWPDLQRLEDETAVILFLILLRAFLASAELHGATGARVSGTAKPQFCPAGSRTAIVATPR